MACHNRQEIAEAVGFTEEGVKLIIVRTAQGLSSMIHLKRGNKIADLRSIFSVLALCAWLGTSLDLEAVGDDEQVADEAVERVFAVDDTPRELTEEQ
jgi:phosphotransferase system HPr (HPr) family protein